MAIALFVLMLHVLVGQAADGVSVSTDMATYTHGDPIHVTIHNAGPDAITNGGIVCDDVWPLAVEQLQADGTWQAVPVPQRAGCIGIAGVLFPQGGSQDRTLALGLDPGTYRVVYAFRVVGGGSAANAQQIAYSDPFDVND